MIDYGICALFFSPCPLAFSACLMIECAANMGISISLPCFIDYVCFFQGLGQFKPFRSPGTWSGEAWTSAIFVWTVSMIFPGIHWIYWFYEVPSNNLNELIFSGTWMNATLICLGSCNHSKVFQLLIRELYKNNIQGTIPVELGNLKSLISLDLYNNNISGTVPPSLGKLKSLVFLWVLNYLKLLIRKLRSIIVMLSMFRWLLHYFSLITNLLALFLIFLNWLEDVLS